MARRKRRGGRRGFRVGKYINLAFKAIAGVVAVSPAVRGVKTMLTGNVEEGGKQVLYDYTGIAPDGSISPAKATSGIGTIIGAVLIAKLGGWLARRF